MSIAKTPRSPELPSLFKSLEREATLSDRVTEQIQQLIVASHLVVGDRLPAERELAEQFGVSRTVVREAVRSLVAKGMLEVKPGSGTAVRMPTAETMGPSMTLFLRGNQTDFDYKQVIEVRRTLEVEIAGLAAERRTDQDLRLLEQILTNTSGIISDRNRFVEWDVSFHAALATATHNELFSLLLDSVVSVMRKAREVGFALPSTPKAALAWHQAIFVEVKKGHGAGARKAMSGHLDEAEKTMRSALGAGAGER